MKISSFDNGCLVLCLFIMSFSTLTQTLQAQVKGLLYLHTDRESYAPGEAVSLKSYLINSNQLLPSDDSLNILLQNLRGEWLIHQTYPIVGLR